MSVRLERKLFTIFKWVIILLPLLILFLNIAYSWFLYIHDVKLAENQDYVQWYQEDQGIPYYEDIYVPNLAENIKVVSNDMNTYLLPKFTAIVNGRQLNTNLFSLITCKILGQHTIVSASNGNFIYFLTTYLSYVTMIEILFLALYMFRFFIHFFINLFERKEDIVK